MRSTMGIWPISWALKASKGADNPHNNLDFKPAMADGTLCSGLPLLILNLPENLPS